MVSVIAPCRNEIRYVEPFVRSLVGQDFPPAEWEVIVADGMSDDGTRDALRELERSHAWLRVIDNPGRIVSTGLNAAVQAARGEFVLRMDMHTEYARDYVRRSVETIRRTGADNVGGPWIARGQGLVGCAIAAVFASPFGTGGGGAHAAGYEGPVDTVYLGCWRKETLERLQFDEALVRNQDDELNLRIVRAGGRVWQSPAIVSWYTPRRELSALFRQYFQYGFWKVAVIRKHRMPASWRHLVPGAFVLSVGALPLIAAMAALLGAPQTSRAAGLLWILLAGAYVAGCVAASVDSARRHGWRLLPVLPIIFAVFHFAYGLGFLLGLLRWSGKAPAAAGQEDHFTRLSR